MRINWIITLSLVLGLGASAWAQLASRYDKRVQLDASMLTNESGVGQPEQMVDEQAETTSPAPAPVGAPKTGWEVPYSVWNEGGTVSAYFDLGQERSLSTLWVYDVHGSGELVIEVGTPGDWKLANVYTTDSFQRWVPIAVVAHTRYLRLTRQDQGAQFDEIALFETTPEEFAKLREKKDAEDAKVAAEAAAAEKLAEERAAGEAKAREAAANRKRVDIGAPFGEVVLIDEIDVGASDPGHLFSQSPDDATTVEHILGQPARVLRKTEGEAAYMTFRIGQFKGLKSGAAYVLEVVYPEDAPRSMVILNAGNETSMGFHTGKSLGDAFHPKYVNNLNESLDVPLSGKYENWRMFFNLHDNFTELEYIRSEGERPLTALDGFPVTIAQWSSDNLPISAGAAVSKIRLYEVPDPRKLDAKYTLPPDDLPRRHLFWREEMADNAIEKTKSGAPAGVNTALDWYKFKANQMSFLGMNTYSKDLLEFGAVQHWDSSPYGGNVWAYFNGARKDLWREIVTCMGERGFDILPYYEYAGSKGERGLGNERRAKPLTRNDAYSHIGWIESANADITDPDTYEDFKKMLDITVLWQRDKATFVGAWIRPRAQMPMGFGDSTRARFAREANNGTAVSKEDLINDKALLERYEQWWFGKRREFLAAMRDHLRDNGIDDATILYTAVPAEPGLELLDNRKSLVVDDVMAWKKRLVPSTDERDRDVKVLGIEEVLDSELYLRSLLAKPWTWGEWELHYAAPQADPQDYKQTQGVLMTMPFNRLYTVNSRKALEEFHGPSGLAIIRHYSLNENMMYDQKDKAKLGYFVAEIERAGPYSMMAEAMAMANGDPTHIGYLRALNFGRGFPEYVRNFNTAFLSLPALPSTLVDGAASDPSVVVRSIPTDKHGTYFAVVNTATRDRAVAIKLPVDGKVTDAATGEALDLADGALQLALYPYQLRALRVEPSARVP